VFGKDVNYNFFLHKVSENFKKIQFIFYDEEGMDNPESAVKTVDLELDKDIRIFLQIWSKAEENVSDPSASADTAKVR
jgi:hypothetical protein